VFARIRFPFLVVFAAYPAFPQAHTGPALAVDAGAARHSVSPDIYGLNTYFADETAGNHTWQYWDLHPDDARLSAGADLRVGLRRWGGNEASRYDWKLDVWNSGSALFFSIGFDAQNWHPELLPAGSRFNLLTEYARMTGGKMMGAVPMLEWLPNARSSATATLCSYSVSKYGPQSQVDPFASDCGDGVEHLRHLEISCRMPKRRSGGTRTAGWPSTFCRSLLVPARPACRARRGPAAKLLRRLLVSEEDDKCACFDTWLWPA
jgi:hypothetical protein